MGGSPAREQDHGSGGQMDFKLVGEVRQQVRELLLGGLKMRRDGEDGGGLLLAQARKGGWENPKVPVDHCPPSDGGPWARCLLCLQVSLEPIRPIGG